MKIAVVVAFIAALFTPVAASAVTEPGIQPRYLGKTYDATWLSTYKCGDERTHRTLSELVYDAGTDAYYLRLTPEVFPEAVVLAYCAKYPL
jgi:hypothetical protein